MFWHNKLVCFYTGSTLYPGIVFFIKLPNYISGVGKTTSRLSATFRSYKMVNSFVTLYVQREFDQNNFNNLYHQAETSYVNV